MKKLYSFVSFLVLCICVSALAGPRVEFRLTSNSYPDSKPAVYGSNVAWVAYNTGDIFWFNGTTTTQITSNMLVDQDVHISSECIVWNRFDGSDWEIMRYDIATGVTTQITNNNYDDKNPRLSGKNITWQGKDGNDWDIFYYDGTAGQTIQVTNNTWPDFNPQIDGDKIVWQHLKYDNTWTYYDIHMYDHSTGIVRKVTDDTGPYLADTEPYISGSKIVWRRWHSPQGIYEAVANIWVYDFQTGQTSILTNTDTDHIEARISGNLVTYQSEREADSMEDLYVWNADNGLTTWIATDNINWQSINFTGNLLTYSGYPNGFNNGSGIMGWSQDGGLEIISHSSGGGSDPRSYGGNIVWWGSRYSPYSTEILLSVLCGDADKDGFVELDDFNALAANWQQNGQWPQGDFNNDGIVNGDDLDLMGQNWNPQLGDFAQMCINAGLVVPDANDDGCAGIEDFAIMAANWGNGPVPPAQWQDGDFNGDGQVNFDDLLILAQNWLTGCDS